MNSIVRGIGVLRHEVSWDLELGKLGQIERRQQFALFGIGIWLVVRHLVYGPSFVASMD